MIFKTQTIPPTDSIDLVEGISLLKTPTGMMFVLLFKILSNLLSHLFFNALPVTLSGSCIFKFIILVTVSHRNKN